MDDVSRGTLFGVPVEFDDSLAPGYIEVRGPRSFERPQAWEMMDNAARLVWMHTNYPWLSFRVGSGTQEWQMTTMNEERSS